MPTSPLKIFIALLLIIPAVGLLAFGPRSTEKLPDDRVIVEYWEKWTGDEEACMRQIVNDFNDTVGAQKHIFVRYLSTSTIQQKTLVATAAGVPPDIAGQFDGNLVQYASLDALEPLDDMAAAAGIDESFYKKPYWDGCHYNGHLWALVSTPGVIALHYNRTAFLANADRLRAAGLDPNRAPQSIAELDRYSDALTIVENGRIKQAGYFPLEPGWYVQWTSYWFGSPVWDGKFELTSPRCVEAFKWIESYADKYGVDAQNEFRGGMANYDSPQNAFLVGAVVMEQQGPWMAHLINLNAPQMNRLPGAPPAHPGESLADRQKYCGWGVAPFPSNDPNLKDVAFIAFDALTIPRGAKHKKEAFEFMAYVNRQDVMEKLCTLHYKNSPLQNVSTQFIENHPNPWIDVFERLARSPNARGVPQIPILPQVVDEINNVAQSVTLKQSTPAEALKLAQDRLDATYQQFLQRQTQRRRTHPSAMQ